jgi:hypothetical protein
VGTSPSAIVLKVQLPWEPTVPKNTGMNAAWLLQDGTTETKARMPQSRMILPYMAPTTIVGFMSPELPWAHVVHGASH